MDFKQLMQEKQDIEDKIRKLENMKQDIKPQVYEKIKSDYNDRLKDLENNIKQNTEAIMQEKSNIEHEIEELDNLLEELETELQEIRVRIQLGEYSEEEYSEQLKEKEEKLNDYKLRKDQLTIKLNEYSMILEAEGVSGEDQGIPGDASPMAESAGMPEEEETELSEEIIPGSEDMPEDKDQLGAGPDSDVGSEIREEDDIDRDEENPLNDILQPALQENDSGDADGSTEYSDNEESDVSEGIEPIDTGLDQFLEEENEGDSEDKTMEGLKCPKCGHVNDPNSITCEKCGTDLFS
ncbi:MAG: zinc ribbon domain-containing protein [candidate division WOR-3 bacterium]|nr:zinc ribbon domain-containing protein [candidate division WOR-3 bacterium]